MQSTLEPSITAGMAASAHPEGATEKRAIYNDTAPRVYRLPVSTRA